MKIKNLIIALLVLSACNNNQKPLYLDPKQPVEERVEDLLSRMTLEEKVAQLQTIISPDYEKAFNVKLGFGNICSIFGYMKPKEAAEAYNKMQRYVIENSRLHIPVLYHGEAVFGLMAYGNTSFPQPLGQASTWNPELQYKMADIIAREVKSRGYQQVLSPDLNIADDVRWGRTHETYGEDPYLASRMGVSFVKAFNEQGIICTPKHFVANIGAGGRWSENMPITERELRERYLPPFEAAVKEGQAHAIMPAYGAVDGIPCHANEWLLTKILRDEWNFDGFTSSDYGGVPGIIDAHKNAKDKKHAAAKAINAGMDVEMPEIVMYGQPLIDAVKEGLVKEEILNRAVKRVLTQKFRLGMFENPYVDPNKAAMVCDHSSHREIAREVSRQACVLLKNENQTLPFSKNIKTIAVLGPLANDVQLGNYAGWGMKTVSVYEGIKNILPKDADVLLEKGVEFGDVSLSTILSNELTLPDGSGHGLKVEYFNNLDLSGNPVLSRTVNNIDFDWGEWVPETVVRQDSFSLRYSGFFTSPVSGKCKIGLTIDDGGRIYLDDILVLDEWKGGSVRLAQCDFVFEKGKKYKLRVEYFDNLFRAVVRLGWSGYPSANLGKAVEYARKADAVVVVVGATDGEGRDRADLELTQPQQDLIMAVAETKTPMVVIHATANVICMSKWIDMVPAMLVSWCPGEEGGNAVAEILFGDYNPGGKLPLTFPQVTGQCPMSYNTKPQGCASRYILYGNEPKFCFGYGLSYTTFEYSNMKISADKIKQGESLTVSVDVKNTGTMKGDEIVQLYLHRNYASVDIPDKLLKDFRRITLNPGETKTVSFTLTPDKLSIYDLKMKFWMEPSVLKVMAGSSLKDIRAEKEFEIME